MSWSVYILRCGNGDLYTGSTPDLERRLNQHQSGRGGWFTQTIQPVELIYQERLETQDEAKCREKQLKGWTRKKKLALIAGDREALKKA